MRRQACNGSSREDVVGYLRVRVGNIVEVERGYLCRTAYFWVFGIVDPVNLPI